MSIQRNEKKHNDYSFFSYIKYPLKIAPVYSLINLVNRIITAALPAIQVFVIARFIDKVNEVFAHNGTVYELIPTLLMIVLIVVYGYINGLVMNLININFNLKIEKYFKIETIQRRAALEYNHFEDVACWDLISRTCNNMGQNILAGFNLILNTLDILIRIISLLLILLTTASWWVVLSLIAACLPILYLAYQGGKATYKASMEALKATRRASYYHNILSNREAVYERKLFKFTKKINDNWHTKYEQARIINLKTNIRYYFRMKSASIATVVVSVIIVVFLSYALVKGNISIGLFISLTGAAFSLAQLMSWTLANVTKEIAVKREYIKEINIFYKLSINESALEPLLLAEEFIFHSVRFENVTFKYPQTENCVLNDLSFTIEKGCSYAFVGINGSGKTTIIKLLTGLYTDYDGEIFINDVNIKEIGRNKLRSIFFVLYQDFEKYAVSIRDNVELGCKDKTNDQQVKDSLSAVGMYTTVERMQKGIDTIVGKLDGNEDLSGGQWQRLSIARALHSNRQVFILDEPTAALDPIAESEIYQMFHDLRNNKTTIMITHRLGAIKISDMIYVLNNGTIVEQGSHTDLLSYEGLYSKMYEQQRSWYIYDEE